MLYLTLKKTYAFVVLLSSLLVCVMILPQVKQAFDYIPVSMAVNKINSKNRLTNEQLVELITTAQNNISVSDAHDWEDLSILWFQLAQQQGLNKIASLHSLQQAKHSIEQSLYYAPSNAFLWYRLALIDTLLQLPNKKVTQLLLMSILTGPYELQYLIPRLNFCLLFFSELTTDDEKDMVRQQLITAWTVSPQTVIGYLKINSNNLTVITELLKEKDADLLQEITVMMNKQKTK
ncbi:MAG: hypothetical protein WAX77_11760 [Methylococcaceae bacterium]